MRDSIKIYSMVKNNDLYSILKLCKKFKNMYKLKYVYIIDWYITI